MQIMIKICNLRILKLPTVLVLEKYAEIQLITKSTTVHMDLELILPTGDKDSNFKAISIASPDMLYLSLYLEWLS